MAAVKAHPDVAQEKVWWDEVKRFRAEATFADASAPTLSSSDVYMHFVEWHRQNYDAQPLMSHNRFGRISKALHAQMGDGDMSKPWTFGLGLIALPEDEEVPQIKAA